MLENLSDKTAKENKKLSFMDVAVNAISKKEKKDNPKKKKKSEQDSNKE